jgi:hypothetical protein
MSGGSPWTKVHKSSRERGDSRTPRLSSLSMKPTVWGMNNLEQMRSIFDQSGLGMVLIGMPGIEKGLAQYPQFFSRIGFVHEFRALSDDADIRVLLEQRWAPVGIHLSAPPPAPEIIAAVIRLTRANFRPLVRLLTQCNAYSRSTALRPCRWTSLKRRERTWSSGKPDERLPRSLLVCQIISTQVRQIISQATPSFSSTITKT